MPEINNFLNPKSVAIVGVSRDKKKIGRLIFEQLVGSQRRVYGVNPFANTIEGHKIYPSIKEIKKSLDLIIYCLPAEKIAASVEEAARSGYKNHLIVAAGFAEAGPSGEKREKELLKLVNKYHISLQGPNCLGNISPLNNFNASFGFNAPKGNIGFISQSGAMGTAFLDWLAKKKLGISSFISLGNKVNLNENDFLQFLQSDKKTKVMALYLESISEGEKFFALTRQISFTKPIVIIKGGQSAEAKIAVTSHTGVLAGSYSAMHAAFRQANLIEADDLEDFFNLIEFCSRYYQNLSVNNPFIISNAGGPSVILVDNYVKYHLALEKPTKKLKGAFSRILPPTSNLNNPIDMLGDADSQRLEGVLFNISKIYPFASLQIVLTPQENTDLNSMSQTIVKFSQGFKGKIIVSLIGGEKLQKAQKILDQSRTLNNNFPEKIPAVLQKIISYNLRQKQKLATNFKHPAVSALQKNNLCALLKQFPNHSFLPEEIALEIAKIYQFPLPKFFLVNNQTDLITKAKQLKYPLALKVSSPLISHRNVVNGVRLDLRNKNDLITAFKAIKKLSDQFLMQEMIAHDVEVIVGAKKDPDFKYLLLFGSGGIHADYLSDVNFGVLPLTTLDLQTMIAGTKISKLIPDAHIFIPLFSSLLALLNDFGQIQEIDINPVVVVNHKLLCLDFKIIV